MILKDVGQAILESYSRILESLAHTVMSRIEDVIYANSLVQDPSLLECSSSSRPPAAVMSETVGPMKFPNPEEEIEKLNSMETPTSMTLSDFMGWHESSESGQSNFDRGKLSKRISMIATMEGLNSSSSARR